MGSKQNYVNVSVVGFFTVLLILTLNASNGRDVLDELVPWIAAQTEATLKETKE